ncbi:hypothetical protein EZS27_006603 [termite gut metagenome]|uniref:Uncharacterized protein n=1 Tax=termite gut metagenome TaxID=433724 RepID=A0A5J4SIA5_9ZZZZ
MESVTVPFNWANASDVKNSRQKRILHLRHIYVQRHYYEFTKLGNN